MAAAVDARRLDERFGHLGEELAEEEDVERVAEEERTISGSNVSTQPKARNMMNMGIMVTCTGNIMVAIMTMNAVSRPRKRNRAKP